MDKQNVSSPQLALSDLPKVPKTQTPASEQYRILHQYFLSKLQTTDEGIYQIHHELGVAVNKCIL